MALKEQDGKETNNNNDLMQSAALNIQVLTRYG
jgi:hypothetical protein